jgi:hypothetical protein
MDLDPIIDLIVDLLLVALDEGGDGSGNFGHAGVPGQQGGSADSSQSNPVVGKTSWAGTEIYKIENASNLTSYGAIVVSKTGTEVLATREEEFHSDIVESVHPGSTVDDYVRFVGKDGILTSNNMSAGITVEDAEENSKAVDLIYKALDKLVGKGLPGDTQVVIAQGTYGPMITTTAEVWASEFQSGQDLDDIKLEYQDTLANVMLDYLTDPAGGSITRFRNEFRRAVNDAFTTTFYTGWADAKGGDTVPEASVDWLVSKIESEIGYADGLWMDLKEMRKVMEPDEVAAWIDARSWGYTNTLDGIYDEAKIRGALEMPLTFGGEDGDETCATCQDLKGQTHPASWWVESELIPGQSGNENFECKGYRCQHVLLDAEGNVYSSELAFIVAKELWYLSLFEGGDGSGNFGHVGIDGQQGGSIGRATGYGGVTDEDKTLFTFSAPSWPKEKALEDSFLKAGAEVGRADTKDAVVDQISKGSGLPYLTTNSIVGEWAHTSNDESLEALSLQSHAAEHFGTNLSDWQATNKGNLDKLSDYGREYNFQQQLYDQAQTRGDFEAADKAYEEQENLKVKFDEETQRLGLGITDEEGTIIEGYDLMAFAWSVERADNLEESYEPFIEETYKGTQEYFASKGYSPDDQVILYRGFSTDDEYREGDAEYIGNALESWSTSPYTAAQFGDVVVAARIPVSGIFSTALTGLGCLTEFEVVVIGGTMPVYVAKGNRL